MHLIMKIIKRLVLSLVLLYTINLIINISGIMLPINMYSIVFVSIFGIPGVFALLFIKVFII